MELLENTAFWFIGIFLTVLTALSRTWLKRFLNQFVPSPQRTLLAIQNFCKTKPLPSEDRFRLVLCWLEADDPGRDTKIVEEAFANIESIELVRSARIVRASGAANQWQSAMLKGTRRVLEKWKADLALVGRVKKPGELLSLWFVPSKNDGTLPHGYDKTYKLENMRLQEDFHDDLEAQLTAEALSAAAPLADTEVRGRVWNKELIRAARELETLLEGSAITDPQRRAELSLTLGNALDALGERESGTERLERAVAAFTEALKVFTRERVPLDWAATQNSLGNALAKLGKRESGTERLERAVGAYTEALKVFTRERVPLYWAATQNNLGNVLATLGKLESGTERLEQAINVFIKALEERTRERVPLDWAATKYNLGNTLVALGAQESGTEHFKQAVAAFTEALEECTRERVPLDWATTRNSLGNALVALGAQGSGTELLEQAINVYIEALEERTCERVPLDWAETKSCLGNALAALGERESGTERLEQAEAAFTEALAVYTPEHAPQYWRTTQDRLDDVRRLLRARRSGMEHLE